MAKIKLNRDSGYVDHQRAYRVVIDGEKRAKISNGESIEIVVEPGNHEILLKIDWLRSNTINFSINKRRVSFMTLIGTMTFSSIVQDKFSN